MSELVKANEQVDNIDIDTELIEKIVERAKKPRIRLEDWSWFCRKLMGNAVNHPRLGNRFVTTSKIIYFDEERKVAESRNTVYELGKKGGR